jgi:signal transduction histidine kinase
MAAIRRPVRSRPIRLFLISMFAVPLLSLIGLWAFASSITVPAAISDHNYNATSVAITSPDAATLTIQLPTEQQETYIWLLSGRQAPKTSLLATRQAITKVLPGAEAALLVGDNLLSASSKADLNTLEADLRRIPSIRQSVDAGTMTAAAAFQAYSTIIDDQFQSYYASTLDRGGSMQAIAVGATDSALALEMVSREVTLVAGAEAVTHGRLDAGARELFVSSAANRQFLMKQTLSLLSPNLRADYVALVNSAPYQQFVAMEGQITAGSGTAPVPVDAKTWSTDSGIVLGAMLKAQTANGAKLSALSASASNGLFTEAVIAGGVGLLAVLASVILPIWFGRKITRDLGALHSSVRAMAEERLPRVVARLRRGEDVDVPAESPPPEAGSIQEVSQVAESFGTVQEAAVEAAVEQARLRKGVNQVFLNISMRNQSLLHRQLGMLDSMERRTSDPAALADLFRLDHLTTRMRRHAEGLIILSGSTPGRGWREPVPIVDVLRAAVAEVEDYVRVDVLSESRDLVAGNAVNDVIHLVAELVENATVFSPPNTRIEVRADRAGTGLVAEIEDRGLGLSQEELDGINRRLASPPEFDLANSEQLGLFVVSRLAVRHAIKVSLRQSVYGGTTAILVLPFGVIVREEEAGSPGGRDEPFADGQPSGGAAVLPAGSSSGAGDAGPLLSFGAAGRHRMSATGRRTETGFVGRDEDGDRPPPPRPLPRAPWEYAQSEPQAPEPAPPPAGQPPWETASWPAAFDRPPADRGPDQRSADSRAGDPLAAGPGTRRGQQPDGPATSGTHLGMPIRVPQASLVPQLRAGRGGPQAAEAADPAVDERSPEVTRNLMDLMQQGWERGRVDDLEDPAGTPDNGTER